MNLTIDLVVCDILDTLAEIFGSLVSSFEEFFLPGEEILGDSLTVLSFFVRGTLRGRRLIIFNAVRCRTSNAS